MIEKKLQKYIIPNIFAMIGVSCYVLADTFFVSAAAGSNGITALNLTLPIYGIMFAIGSMIGLGSVTQYSLGKALGHSEIDTYFSNSILWNLIISIFFITLGITAPDLVLKLMGADQMILQTGLSYMRTILCFAPFFMLNYTFTAFVRNDGNPRLAMIATLSSSIFNIIFDYVFMFPLGMGMFGAALATAISPIVSICICMIHYTSKRNTIRFVMCMPSIRKLVKSCSLGVGGFVGEISNGVTSMVFNLILLGLIGNIAVAAYGVIANISLVGISIFNGIAQGLQPMASEATGKNDTEAQHRIYKHSILIGILLAVLLVATCFLFTDSIVDIFNSEHSIEMADYAVTGLRIYSLGFLIASMNLVTAGFLGAVGKARECSILSISRGIVAISCFAFILSRIWGILGVWMAFPASELFTFLLFLCMEAYKRGREQH